MKDPRTRKIEELKARNKKDSVMIADLETRLESAKAVTDGYFNRLLNILDYREEHEANWVTFDTLLYTVEQLIEDKKQDDKEAESRDKENKHLQKLLKKEHDLNQSLLRRLLDED